MVEDVDNTVSPKPGVRSAIDAR